MKNAKLRTFLNLVKEATTDGNVADETETVQATFKDANDDENFFLQKQRSRRIFITST